MASALLSPPLPVDAAAPLKGFKAYGLYTTRNPVPSYNRLDFYKVSLVTGHIVVQYAGRTVELKGTHLFFANPRIPYYTLLLSAHVTGYACLFTEEFAQGNSPGFIT
jgi:AraC family transcriptional activator of pobA